MEPNRKATLHYGRVQCSHEHPMILQKEIIDWVKFQLERNKNQYTKTGLPTEKMQEAYRDAIQDLIQFITGK
jgi:hypothetical protein